MPDTLTSHGCETLEIAIIRMILIFILANRSKTLQFSYDG